MIMIMMMIKIPTSHHRNRFICTIDVNHFLLKSGFSICMHAARGTFVPDGSMNLTIKLRVDLPLQNLCKQLPT